MAKPVTILLLSGRSGSGKSTVANEVSHQLAIANVHHVHIDGDNLDATYPEETSPELMLANLRGMWGNYYRLRGCRNVVISGTGMVFEYRGICEVVSEVCGEDVVVRAVGVVLVVGDEVVEKRLSGREIGTDLERHLESSRRMDGVLREMVRESVSGEGFRVRQVVNDGSKSVKDVAEEIIKLSGFI